MAEELYFYKLNSEKAKTELIQQLKVDDEFSYQKYSNKYADEELNFEEVIRKIEENIELLSIDEFWSISNWFWQRIETNHPNIGYDEQYGLFIKLMSASGMELFYEIPSKTPVRKFHSILWDYECHMQTDIMHPLVGNICKSLDFNDFLRYGICFSGELCLFLNHKYYKNGDDDDLKFQKEIDEINWKHGTHYHEMALKELEKQNEYNLETMSLIPALLEFRRSTAHLSIVSYPTEMSELSNREDELLNFAASFYHFIELKEMTENYSGTILRLHSC